MITILVRVVFKYLARILPFVSLKSWLWPTNQLNRHQNDWMATGNDPQFMLPVPLTKPGWCLLEVVMDFPGDTVDCRLYPDFGNGFSEETAIGLTLAPGTIGHRYCYMDKVPNVLRFDPTTTKGPFSIVKLSLEGCDEIPSKAMLERIMANHHAFRGLTSQRVEEHLRQRSRTDAVPYDVALLRLYEATFRQTPSCITYYDWIETTEAAASREIQEKWSNRQQDLCFSILVPVYNPRLSACMAMVESVRTQSYTNWQLCLVDDASTDTQIRDYLASLKDTDPRILTKRRVSNGHISKTTNDALAMATGDFCALLDHDDILHPDALAHMADFIGRHNNAQVLYSDEDKFDENLGRYDPHFKPDFNVDLLYSQNYISHLGVYRTELLKSLGGFRTGVEGSQDHDLILRCVNKVPPETIIHVPHVLYHWRAEAGSTALAAEEKNYTEDASIKALNDHFTEQAVSVSVAHGLLPNTYRCHWEHSEQPLVSLIIPTRNQVQILKTCVESIIEKTDYSPIEILIVDNQSDDQETLEYLAKIDAHPLVRVVAYDHPFNYSALNNFAAAQSAGEVLGLINNDIEVINSGWLSEMVSHALRPDIGCVGAKLYYPNDLIQHAGVITGIGGVAGHSHKYFKREDPGYFSRLQLIQNYSAVTAAAMVIRRSVFEEAGGLRESLAVAFNDVDFCLRVRALGYRNLWTPFAELYHHESISRGDDLDGKKLLRFREEQTRMLSYWGEALNQDPCYNPNLTHLAEDFSIADPETELALAQENSRKDLG